MRLDEIDPGANGLTDTDPSRAPKPKRQEAATFKLMGYVN